MSFNKVLLNYYSELQEEFLAAKNSGEATEELSFRTSLDNLFKNIAKLIDDTIVTIPEPKNQYKMGRPDWRFHNSESMGVYGYVEAKGIDSTKKISVAAYEEQVKKYLTIGNPVILTDGIDFILFKPNGSIEEYSLCEKPLDWSTPIFNFEIEVLFRKFFGKIGYRTISENQLVTEVANRARLLTDEILEFLDLEEEAINQSELHTLVLLKELKHTTQLNHDKSLSSDPVFASFISQILTFGLLYAHRIIIYQSEVPAEKYERIHDFWFSVMNEEYTEKLLPFKTLVMGLKSELNSDLSRLGLWYDDLRRLLSHIKLSDNQIHVPDYHELYETFLTKYDPDVRFDYGAFYTPRVLAFYTVAFAKKIIKKAFPEINLAHPKTKFIDPCCGTGTFIEAILKQIKPDITSEIVGFEILPVPYALAHYRIALLDKVYPENIKIKLTNALSDSLFDNLNETQDSIGNILAMEQQEAYRLANPPLTLIIGNPPSSDSKFTIENEGKRIKDLVKDFRPEEKFIQSRQNIQKQLSNEFVKFLRWTVDRAINSKPSTFVLIIPSSFAKHTTYKYARKYLVENFEELWVLDFDSDNRTGVGDANIFKTRQGRLILVGVCKVEKHTALIKYKSIAKLSSMEKSNFFKNLDINLDFWKKLQIDEKNYVLKPQIKYDEQSYKNFWPLSNLKDSGIFLRHCSSLKLAPTHLLIHASYGQLKRRSRFISKKENDFDEIKQSWYSGQRKPPPASKITDKVRDRLNSALDEDSIFDYSYRPFLETKVLLDDDLLNELQHLGGGGTRDRPEVRAAFEDNRILGFTVSPAPEDLGNTLNKFSSFCWHMPDNDLSKRGNAHVFCNYFPEYKKKGNWDSTNKININGDLLSALTEEFELKQDIVIEQMIFYCYAMLSSNVFLETFKGALFSVAGEWPRIPITKIKTNFIEVAEYGKALAKIESKNYQCANGGHYETELLYHKYSLTQNTISLKDINGKIVKEFTGIDSEVMDFEVSGYNVVKEWLKLHSYPYYRKPLNHSDLQEFTSLLEKIVIYTRTVEDMDVLIDEILEGNNLLIHKPPKSI